MFKGKTIIISPCKNKKANMGKVKLIAISSHPTTLARAIRSPTKRRRSPKSPTKRRRSPKSPTKRRRSRSTKRVNKCVTEMEKCLHK